MNNYYLKVHGFTRELIVSKKELLENPRKPIIPLDFEIADSD